MVRGEQRTFEEHIAESNVSGARLGYLLSAILMPSGLVLDFIAHLSHFTTFVWIRLAAGLVAFALHPLCRLKALRKHPVWLGAGPPLLCAITIQITIEQLDGYASPYYAGLCLCILAVGVLYTWRWVHALIVCGGIVGVWVAPSLPALIQGRVDLTVWFNNLYFLSLTTVISVASTVIRYRLARSEFSTRMQLTQTSQALAGTLDRLREIDRLKNEFFANISHELRTPLTLILSPVEDLLSRTGPVANQTALRVIHRNGQRLLRLIDDLLDLAKLEAGGLRLRVAAVDLPDLGKRVVDAAHPTAVAYGVALKLETEGSVADMWGDPHRLEIVVTNLVGNALKFTPKDGHVTVRIVARKGGAVIEVADDGPGIPERELTRIFERFYQVEGSERRRHGGTGIGLALARQLVELHSGQLTVESQVGQGSTFCAWLPSGSDHFREAAVERRQTRAEQHPRRRSEDETPRAEIPVEDRPAERISDNQRILLDGRRPRVLVAEDEDDLRAFLHSVLNDEFDVSVARDGAEALTLVQRDRPDLVLTDVMMPGVSGTDLCRSIKSDPALAHTPVILLTARSGSDATLDGYTAGADDFVVKPFHTRVLLARVRAQLKLRWLSLQLAHQAQLSLSATLAAGVAHEVRNPVNAILNAAEVLRRNATGEDTRRDRLLGAVTEAAQRISNIVSALDDHVRPADGADATVFDVRGSVDSCLRLLEHRSNGVHLHTDYGAALPIIAAPREFNQVLMNLLDNALRAEPANIWVTVLSSDARVRIHVADDGPGVAPEIADKIFDPFFTMRAPGEGTGLGLYLARKTVSAHGGDLRLLPRAGGGAEFVVEMPGVAG
jgi:signal transduction histidine kinase